MTADIAVARRHTIQCDGLQARLALGLLRQVMHTAVSYTHLDVYKRPVLDCGHGLVELLGGDVVGLQLQRLDFRRLLLRCV